MKRYLLRSIVILVMALVACSVEIAQTIEVSTPFPTAAPRETPSPGGTPLAEQAQETAGSEQPLATPAPFASLDLSTLDLTGRLIVAHGQQGILSYDLSTGERTTLFEPPHNGLVTGIAVSDDGSLIAMSYAPPPAEGEIQIGYTGLYILPADGSGEPSMLFQGDENNVYFSPAWSPDGRFLYFGHSVAGQASAGVAVERIAYPGGQPEVVLASGLWPTLSPDGTTLAFVATDRDTFVDELYVVGLDGSDPRRVMDRVLFPAVDAPRFSPDDSTILFSAANEEGEYDEYSSRTGSLVRAFGLSVASAHTAPSDLWSVPVEGGRPTRLTELHAFGMKADYAPDGQSIAFSTSTEGIFLMNLDGTELGFLIDQGSLNSLEWVP